MVDMFFVDNVPNYYRLLHVHPDAPAAVIKASYRAMMQKMRLHPDLGGDEGVAQQLNIAVATLCHSIKRSEYDALLAAQDGRSQPAPGGTPTSDASNTSDTSNSAQADQTGRSGTSSSHGQAQSSYRESAHKASNEGYTEAPYSAASASRNTHLFPTKPHCPFCHTVYPAKAPTNRMIVPDIYDKTNRCSQCQGSATPINQLANSDNDDLRRIYRHDHKTPVLLWSHWPTVAPITATMTDLSTAGCALEYSTVVDVNTVVLLDSPLLNGIGKIRYSRPSECGSFITAGLEFLTLQITAEPGAVFSVTA